MKTYTLLLFLTHLIFCNAQDFVGKDAYLYLNATVKPNEASSEGMKQYMYKNFYLQFDTVTAVLTKDYIGKKKSPFKPFQTGEYASTSVSEYAKLVGIEFKVVGVYEEKSQYEFDKGRKYVLVLKNDALGTLYYEYDTKYKHDLEFTVVDGLTYPEGYWCNKFTVNKDKFEDKTTYYSPKESGFIIIKVISKEYIRYYLSVEVGGSTATIDGKGLFLLFDDGTKITKENAAIDVKVGNSGGFIYSAFVDLTAQDLEMLKTKQLTDHRLYIYDGTVNKESASLIQEYIKCVMMK